MGKSVNAVYDAGMSLLSIDHVVFAVRDVSATVDFYRTFLGAGAEQNAAGKWALRIGRQKVNLQPADAMPDIARGTIPGTANICFLTDAPVADLARRLTAAGIELLVPPSPRDGATGPIMSIYFHDPDGNLIEVAEPLTSEPAR